jgi:ATP-dependent Clp protease ATP-binding subunit ClpA
MFERFTGSARQVVVSARQEARRLRHPFIGAEHLLLALLDDRSGATAGLLRDAGVTRERALAELARLAPSEGGPDVLGEGDAAALRAIGIDLNAVRAKVEEIFGPDAFAHSPSARPAPRRGLLRRRPRPGGPFSGRAKKVLELSLREAIALHHNFIGSEHILLGLLRDGGGLAGAILAEAAVDVDALRRRIIAALSKAA